MFIKLIELKGNTRLMIRDNYHIKVDFTEPRQLILGSNGSGKSSLMNELSPLPANGQDYEKDGFKRIVIEHKGIEYELVNRFSKQAGEHSFIQLDTGEELNPGGTQSVQKQLVEEIFGLDSSLHDVLTDQVKFTSMSPIQRRDWLTRISGSNLDYVMGIFNKIKRLQRDEDGVVKHLTNRLNKESSDVLNEMDLKALSDKFYTLNEEIKTLYEFRVHGELPEVDIALENINEKMKIAIDDAQAVLRVYFNPLSPKFTSIEEFINYMGVLESKIVSDEESVVSLKQEHTDINNLLAEVDLDTDTGKLEETLKGMSKQIEVLKNECVYFTKIENASQLYGQAKSVQTSLLDIVSEMVNNTDSYFNKERVEDSKTKQIEIANENTRLMREQSRYEERIRHINTCESIDCPKCGSHFKPGINENEIPELQNKIGQINERLMQLDKDRKRYDEYMDEFNRFNHYLKQLNGLVGSNKAVIPQSILDMKLMYLNPTKVLSEFDIGVGDFKRLSEIEGLLGEVYKIEAAIDKVNSVNSSGMYTKERLSQIEINISEKLGSIENNKRKLTLMKKEYGNYKEFVNKNEIFNARLEEIKQLVKIYVDSFKKQTVDNAITQTNLVLANVNKELKEAQNKRDVLDDIVKSRDESIYRNDNLKVLMSEINPTTGLIADFFKQFINQFVEQINVIMDKVWEHPIELLPCGIDDAGLTYKFPLRVNNKPYGPPDGSRGSNSQITIVNFAFKIVVMIYLGLEDYPLYLDELAPDFDEKHRINIIHFVRDFVESKRCSQMFMVSHYLSGYGVFTNAQILVLDEENMINVPERYNEHAILSKVKL